MRAEWVPAPTATVSHTLHWLFFRDRLPIVFQLGSRGGAGAAVMTTKTPSVRDLDAVSCVSQASIPSQLNSQSSSAFVDRAVLLYGIPDNAENIYVVTNK
jgi:hypothetical protein